MSRKISVFGLGYVGAVTAACLAHRGHTVVGVDLSPAKTAALAAGRSPIVEPRIGEIIAEAHAAGRLTATQDAAQAVLGTDISFLCVGTPSLRNGKIDLGHVEPVCREIGQVLRQKRTPHVVALRSTVLPGTAETVVIPALEAFSGRKEGETLHVCANPEFMREGSAVADFMAPSMTVIGAHRKESADLLADVYAWAPAPCISTSLRTAEMLKYVCNAWHAVKVAFANETGSLAKQMGVDAAELMQAFITDEKLNISASYLQPGFAFGGSCLPKDVRALQYRARELDLELPMLESVLASNEVHLERAVEMVLRTGMRRVAVLGLSFKADTDDLRESPQVQLVKRLLGEGCSVRVWDENVSLGRLIGSNRQYIEDVIPHVGSLLRTDLADALAEAEVVVLGTRAVAPDRLQAVLQAGQLVVDLVNIEKSRRLSGHDGYQGICW